MEIIIRNDKVLMSGVEYIKSQSFNNNTSMFLIRYLNIFC